MTLSLGHISYKLLSNFLVRENPPNSDVTFNIHYFPYQPHPDASAAGEDKYEWYKKSRYGDSEEKMKVYANLMTACKEAGIEEKEASEIIDDEYEVLPEVKSLIREQASNGVDSVPYIVMGEREGMSLLWEPRKWRNT
jgi:predicted DsbA family dithiol-disulfide isomerase